jgi:aminoglycoside phosphotransferase (APT) family kinase protein
MTTMSRRVDTGTDADPDEPGWADTCAWVERNLPPGHRVRSATALLGGWTSRMRRLDVEGDGDSYSLVLRSFVKPFFVKHAPGLLTREADVLRLLAGTDVPAARLVAVDATAEHCDRPSLLMSLLPGRLVVDDDAAGVARRSELLAGQLAAVHAVRVTEEERPRVYQAWASPGSVRLPDNPASPRCGGGPST